MTNEEFYDQEIAPALLELCKKCQDRKMPFIATVNYGLGDYGTTRFLGNPPELTIRTMWYAAQASGNVDALIRVICNDAREYGHSSLFLHLQGIPENPKTGNDPGTIFPPPLPGSVNHAVFAGSENPAPKR